MKTTRSLIGLAVGLMFQKPKEIMLEFPCEGMWAVHTWFMRFPIDLTYLDKDREIVEVKKNVRPWRYYKPRKKAKYLIESPSKGNI